MKIVLIVMSILILAAFLGLYMLGLVSQSGKANGLVEGELTQCPDKPNCVCSEFDLDVKHYIEPIRISQDRLPEVLSRVQGAIHDMGGSIQVENDNYLAATFTSSLFRFVDDLEIRIDLDQKTIHLRSASRVGYSDRGVNRKRIERLKILYQ